eukprot:TRINITY_DN26042_c0_g1_i1.p1 TRINITY_DN26042_c0_g1~~TRINITY_DN26042_c0_g1_i1.p1  ORF type:complete len:510 (+),score=99.71 TRINITY_DN26042_c0_g1_i1:157-1530(+)
MSVQQQMDQQQTAMNNLPGQLFQMPQPQNPQPQTQPPKIPQRPSQQSFNQPSTPSPPLQPNYPQPYPTTPYPQQVPPYPQQAPQYPQQAPQYSQQAPQYPQQYPTGSPSTPPRYPQQNPSQPTTLKAPPNNQFLNNVVSSLNPPPKFDVKLTTQQKLDFIRNGYIIIPSVVPRNLVNNALRSINHHLSRDPSENKTPIPRSITSCPDLVSSKVLMDLFYESPASSYVEQLVGQTNRLLACQIALRYPGDGCMKANIKKFGGNFLENNPLIGGVVNQLLGGDTEESNFVVGPGWKETWHIDGFKEIFAGQVQNFTCLVGILLSDLPEELSGNLTLYPGSHHLIEKFFREKGGVLNYLKTTKPPVIQQIHQEISSQLPEPIQVRGKPGDLIICHYQLPHAIAPNISPNIRYCIYFRVFSHCHGTDSFRPDTMTDIWMDFEGLVDFKSEIEKSRSAFQNY